MIYLNKEELKFLKSLKKLKTANEDDIRNIYLLYRKLINNPQLVDEYKNCNCPSLLREFHFELVLHYQQNKKEYERRGD